MEVSTGTPQGADAAGRSGGVDQLLGGVRRLAALADGAPAPEHIYRGLARELLQVPGADEVHLHHLAAPGVEHELVVVYMFDADARLSYLLARGERPPGVSWVASTGRSLLATDEGQLAAQVPRLLAAGEMGSALLLPLSKGAAPQAVLTLVRRAGRAYQEPAVTLAATLVDQAATALALVDARAEAGTDAVAGCMNHRAMRRRLDEEIDRAARTGNPLSCLLIDLDDFKAVNDRHGHQAGDATLRAVVHTLIGEFRAFDRVARYGGDEFVVILPNADLKSAAAAAARALESLQAAAPFDGGDPVSASIGVAQWRAPMSTEQLLEACDRALLRSKRQGKGRVTKATDPIG
jgi:diguanylate cyclase (GGDEF)-like protein